MLALRDVTKTFGARVAVDHVSLTVARGTTRILLGSSGSGKSTILRLILGLLRPDHGEISVDGGMGYVVQEGALYPHLTARQNEIGRASCRERVERSVVGGSFKKKKKNMINANNIYNSHV